jgi:hypothetical protein
MRRGLILRYMVDCRARVTMSLHRPVAVTLAGRGRRRFGWRRRERRPAAASDPHPLKYKPRRDAPYRHRTRHAPARRIKKRCVPTLKNSHSARLRSKCRLARDLSRVPDPACRTPSQSPLAPPRRHAREVRADLSVHPRVEGRRGSVATSPVPGFDGRQDRVLGPRRTRGAYELSTIVPTAALI